jgi:hypothetical protein
MAEKFNSFMTSVLEHQTQNGKNFNSEMNIPSGASWQVNSGSQKNPTANPSGSKPRESNRPPGKGNARSQPTKQAQDKVKISTAPLPPPHHQMTSQAYPHMVHYQQLVNQQQQQQFQMLFQQRQQQDQHLQQMQQFNQSPPTQTQYHAPAHAPQGLAQPHPHMRQGTLTPAQLAFLAEKYKQTHTSIPHGNHPNIYKPFDVPSPGSAVHYPVSDPNTPRVVSHPPGAQVPVAGASPFPYLRALNGAAEATPSVEGSATPSQGRLQAHDI